MAAFKWNEWQHSSGMGGSFGPEYADLTKKLIKYINLPSLLEYVLIEPEIVSIQVLRKNNHWMSEYYFLGDSVTFESIGLTLTVEEVYDRVDNQDMNEFREQTLLPPE